MRKTLGGVCFVRNAFQYDYCIEESLNSMLALCDTVVVCEVGSTDGTKEFLAKMAEAHDNLFVISIDDEDWHSRSGKERIAHYQNIAAGMLDTDYYILCQADEVIDEKSFNAIWDALATNSEAILVTRINLWGSADTYINVPENRQPCSTKVVRIAKLKYQSVGDGEGIACVPNESFVNRIKIWHYGFVRKKEVMKAKIINMQTGVFQMKNYDPKLNQSEIFDSTLWFKDDELSPVPEEHPIFIQEWISTRP